ncbi:MAG: hypothetical protein WC742_03990 [Gallionellaceae bacterium]
MIPEAMHSCGLGSYAFSKLIEWGKKLHPEYTVERLSLSPVDAKSDEARERRNGFYRKHGFEMDFSSDKNERSGSCSAESLSHLSEGINTSKVKIFVNFADTISLILVKNANLERDCTQQLLAINTYKERNKVLTEKNAKILVAELLVVILSLTLTAHMIKLIFTN